MWTCHVAWSLATNKACMSSEPKCNCYGPPKGIQLRHGVHLKVKMVNCLLNLGFFAWSIISLLDVGVWFLLAGLSDLLVVEDLPGQFREKPFPWRVKIVVAYLLGWLTDLVCCRHCLLACLIGCWRSAQQYSFFQDPAACLLRLVLSTTWSLCLIVCLLPELLNVFVFCSLEKSAFWLTTLAWKFLFEISLK